MIIHFANNSIEKICKDDKAMLKSVGQLGSRKLRDRIDQIKCFDCLERLRFESGNFHELKGDRKGQIACSLIGRLRLVFEPANEPIPLKPDGGLDWQNVTSVRILEIIDYH